MPESILSLRESILLEVLTQWIFDDDLCYLDSAVCNSQLRWTLILLLRKCVICNANNSLKCISSKNGWLALRCLKSESVSVTHADLWMPHRYITFCTQVTKSIESPAESQLAEFIRSKKLNLVRLKLHSKATTRTLVAILRAAPTLTELDLGECTCIPSKIGVITQHCHDLRSIVCPSIPAVACDPTILEGPQIESVRNFSICHYDSREKQFHVSYDFIKDNSHSRPYIRRGLNSFYMNSFRCLKYSNMDCGWPFRIDNKFSHLTSFDCSYMEDLIPKVIMDLISACSGCLRSLAMNGCSVVTDQLVRTISDEFKMLEKLYVNECRVSHQCLLGCVRSSRFKVLSFEKTDVEHHRMQKCALHANVLVIQSFKDCSFKREKVGRNGNLRRHTYSAFKVLRYGKFFECAGTSLKELVVKEGHFLRDPDIDCLQKHCDHLTSIEFSVSDKECSGYFIFTSLAKIKPLVACTISWGNFRTCEVEYFLKEKPMLEKLALPYCRFRGEVLSLIATHCPGIRHVNVSHNFHIQSGDVSDLLRGCPLLHSLNLDQCEFVDITLIPLLKTRRMKLLITNGCIAEYDDDGFK